MRIVGHTNEMRREINHGQHHWSGSCSYIAALLNAFVSIIRKSSSLRGRIWFSAVFGENDKLSISSPFRAFN